MRSTDERAAAVERRVKELARQKKQRQSRYLGLSAAAACLLVVVGMGAAMPGIMAGLSQGDYTNTGMMASIFYEGGALGYVLIGLLAFALGVCLTVLCFLLRRGSHRDKADENDDRNN
ncbi:hypothetical protein Sgly_1028 [Syntrophobotulus glycolicus DSM 8271]|uniref:DUF4179 domain-containing protein n=1 Tax=Syntrophobotulus glycolicus (strain DSM 8271 / FlGlyR) TaxID=645991 RepID=F0STS0_SYNGF|nr:hypothetical protein [Syntrophobotulus glycolicus]ADY55360.1 hypothetical protein Sgly_1028 [Syntrophobotulus glycolicus DSM 8271]